MANENLHIFNDPNLHLGKAQFYNELFTAYAWHFRIKERPATFEELSRFAKWEGLQIKEPTKKDLVDFFLEKNITF